MKKILNCIYLFIALTSVSVHAQFDFANNYVPISSQGLLPQELSKTEVEKLNEQLSLLVEKNNPDFKAQKKYYTDLTSELQQTFINGNVLYNTVINRYLEKIVDVILQDNPELRKKIHVYPIMENKSNAWAYDNGNIFITLDYIARLQSEAQLAMVLCHEISHVIKQHGYSRYIKGEEVLKEVKRVSESKKDTAWKQERTFYKIQESEADLSGFELLKKSGYSVKDIPAEFDRMLLCDFSFENIPFDISYFNKNQFKINENIFYKEIKPIRIDANYDDTWHTHPNIYKRRIAIENNIKNNPISNNKDYIVSKDTFDLIADISKFETCRINLRDFELSEMTYHAYCLQKKFPNNYFLKSIIGNAFYQMAVQKSASSLYYGFYGYSKSTDYQKENANKDSTMGHVAQLKQMFKRLNGEDFTLLAINYDYGAYKESNYQDDEKKQNLDTLFSILSKNHNLNYQDFYKSDSEIKSNAIDSSFNHVERRIFADAIDRKSAFINYINDPQFKSFFLDTTSKNDFGFRYVQKGRTKKLLQGKEKNKEEKIVDINNLIVDKKELKNISDILVLSPDFSKKIYRSYDSEEYPLEASDNATYYRSELSAAMAKENYKIKEVDDKRFASNEIEKYNNLSSLRQLLEETDNHYELNTAKTFNVNKNDGLIKYFGCNYVLKTKVDEYIYNNVRYYDDTYGAFYRNGRKLQYLFEIVNIKTGCIVYHRSFIQSVPLQKSALKKYITEELSNILELKQKT